MKTKASSRSDASAAGTIARAGDKTDGRAHCSSTFSASTEAARKAAHQVGGSEFGIDGSLTRSAAISTSSSSGTATKISIQAGVAAARPGMEAIFWAPEGRVEDPFLRSSTAS